MDYIECRPTNHVELIELSLWEGGQCVLAPHNPALAANLYLEARSVTVSDRETTYTGDGWMVVLVH